MWLTRTCSALADRGNAGYGFNYRVGREQGWPDEDGSRLTWAKAEFFINVRGDGNAALPLTSHLSPLTSSPLASGQVHNKMAAAADANKVYEAWAAFVIARNDAITTYTVTTSTPPTVVQSCDYWVRMIMELKLLSGVLEVPLWPPRARRLHRAALPLPQAPRCPRGEGVEAHHDA